MHLENILKNLGENINFLEKLIKISNHTIPNNITVDLYEPSPTENHYSTLIPVSDNFKVFNNIISVLSLIIILIGLIGNFISINVLLHPNLRMSTNIFLCSLCISSFISLFGMATGILVHTFGHRSIYSRILFYIYPVTYPLTLSFQMASILLLVAVSINRFIFVFYSKGNQTSAISRKRERENDNKRAINIIILIYLSSLIYCVPYWFVFEYDSKSGSVELTTLGISPSFKYIIYFGMYLPIVYIMPFTILVITNSYLVIFLINLAV